MALGTGVLVLVGVVSLSVWLVQRDDDPGPVPVASDGIPAASETGGQLPGLPPRDAAGEGVNGGASFASSGASVSDSAKLEVREAEARSSQSGPGDAVNLQVSAELLVHDSAELSLQQGQPAPPRGSGDVASIADTAELVVRDASGNIKQRETVR